MELVGSKFGQAVAKVTDEVEQLLDFHDYRPSTGSTADDEPDRVGLRDRRHRTRITRRPGSKAAGLAMAYKLVIAAQYRSRAVNAPQLVTLVRVGATFVNEQIVDRPEDHKRHGTG